MNSVNRFGPKFEVDSHVNESEILQLEMKSLDNRGMNYEIYSKGFLVYYFKRIEGQTLQLFCCTSKESYYLSNDTSMSSQNDKVGLLDWLFT